MAIAQIPVAEIPDEHPLLDVREPNEFAAGHTPGAISIPLGQLRERLSEVPTGTPLLVICRSGGRSQKACEFLLEQGLDVANVAGGTTAWAQAGKQLEADVEGVTPEVVAPTTPPPASV